MSKLSLRLFFFLVSAGLATSCGTTGLEPESSAYIMGETVTSVYTLENFKSDRARYAQLSEAVDLSGNEPRRRLLRDRMTRMIITDITAHYGAFEGTFFKSRAETEFGFDFVNLGLDAAVTIAGGERTKTVLGAIATAVHGTDASFDKNFYREKTSESIISTMRADRLRIRNEISKKLLLPDDKYRFEEAWGDLIELFYAGTVPSALTSIAAAAGEKAKKAEKEETQIVEIRTGEKILAMQLSAATVAAKSKITDSFNALNQQQQLKAAKSMNKALGDNLMAAKTDFKSRLLNAATEADLKAFEDAIKAAKN